MKRVGIQMALAATAAMFAALPLFDRAGALEWIAVFGVALSAGAAVWPRLARTAGVDDPGIVAVNDTPAEPDALSSLLVGVLPVWKQQVDAVKTQTEQAITELVGNFSSISEQFESAGFKGTGDTSEFEDDGITLLTLCEHQLQPVIVSMHSLMEGKGVLAASVKDLATATLELQNMASSVSQIAAQTNMLAINAAIEAARAGDTGRGFAVIAKEIRNLSQVSAQTGKQITERMAQVTKIMKTTVEAAARAAVHDQAAIELSGTVVEDVLGHVRELSVKADEMRGQGNIIRSDIESLLVSLQFQDRVSQIISVIDTDIDRLRKTVESDDAIPPPGQWLSELQRNYTMDDQRRIQAGVASPARANGAVAAPAANEVDFF